MWWGFSENEEEEDVPSGKKHARFIKPSDQEIGKSYPLPVQPVPLISSTATAIEHHLWGPEMG